MKAILKAISILLVFLKSSISSPLNYDYELETAAQPNPNEYEKIVDRFTKITLDAIKEVSIITKVDFTKFLETQDQIKKTVDTLAKFHGIKIDPEGIDENETNHYTPRLTRRESEAAVKSGSSSSPCGADPSWVEYNQEKCYKVSDQMKPWEDATSECNELDPEASTKLLTIQTMEEQKYLSSLLFEKLGIVENIWINGNLNPNDQQFYTTDKTELRYTNWANGAPTNISGRNCIQMTSMLPGSEPGEWINAYCSVRNVFVCQKRPQFTVGQLGDIVLDLKRKLELLDSDAAIPIGFIYTQFPNQTMPQSIWPQFKWEDISSSFQGSFFRANGGSSGAFGSIQDESSPHLEQVIYHDGEGEITTSAVPLAKGVLSKAAYVGDFGRSSDRIGLRFLLGNSEVRPKNMAIKIWKRIE